MALVRTIYFLPRGLLDAVFWISDDSGGNTPRFWLLQGSACTEPGMFLQGLPPPRGVMLSDKSRGKGGRGDVQSDGVCVPRCAQQAQSRVRGTQSQGEAVTMHINSISDAKTVLSAAGL